MTISTRSTYSRVAIVLHWTVGGLMILNILGGFFHESFGKAAVPVIMSLHKATGILVLVLTVARLLWRLTHRPPSLAATVRGWEKALAHATHGSFYFLMFALPVTGWLMSSAGGRKYSISFYGLFDVPFLPVVQDKAAANLFAEQHEVLGFVTVGLIILHFAAALKHHVFDKDDTVIRMLPILRDRRPN
jgi:cytochrome b561